MLITDVIKARFQSCKPHTTLRALTVLSMHDSAALIPLSSMEREHDDAAPAAKDWTGALWDHMDGASSLRRELTIPFMGFLLPVSDFVSLSLFLSLPPPLQRTMKARYSTSLQAKIKSIVC
jgi:hypothetical protein